MTLEEQLRAQGGDWGIGGIDRAAELAALLRNKGITSLDGLKLNKSTGKREVAGYWGNDVQGAWVAPSTEEYVANKLMFGNKAVGFLGDYNNDGSYGNKSQSILKGTDGSMLGWSSRGDGAVGYHAVEMPDGTVKIVPYWGDTSDKKKLMQAAMVLGAPVALWAAGGGLAAAGAAETAGGAAGAAEAAGGAAGAAEAAGGIATLADTLPAVPGMGIPLPPGGGLVGAALALPSVATVPALTGAAAVGALPSWLPSGLAPAWDFIKQNPQLAGALAGGLLGGVASEAGKEEAPAPYTGPMPTITRGGWQADARGGYKPMQVQQYGGGLLGQNARPSGGLGRYTGLLGG